MRNEPLLLLFLAACTQTFTLDLKDIPIEPPVDLDRQLARYRSGEEKWRGDPKIVADVTLREKLDIHAAPWMAGPYHAPAYEVRETPKAGVHVVRGYVYPSGGVARYRVKVRPYHEIWYPVEVSHYKEHKLPHPALED